jgi:hypothetical protein
LNGAGARGGRKERGEVKERKGKGKQKKRR